MIDHALCGNEKTDIQTSHSYSEALNIKVIFQGEERERCGWSSDQNLPGPPNTWQQNTTSGHPAGHQGHPVVSSGLPGWQQQHGQGNLD